MRSLFGDLYVTIPLQGWANPAYFGRQPGSLSKGFCINSKKEIHLQFCPVYINFQGLIGSCRDMKKLTFLVALAIIANFQGFGQQYIVNGDAVQQGNCYRLTQDQNFEGGSVWYQDKVDLTESFDLYFDIFLGCKDNDGADGIAFVLQPISTSIGSAGGGLGYAGVDPSVVIEIDTWQNAEANDPVYDHIAVQIDGNVGHGALGGSVAGPVPVLPGSANIEDCSDHTMRVTWDATTNTLNAYIDCNLTISYTGDIINTVFDGDSLVFWGFTGATGGFNNVQNFCLDYISFVEAERDTAICEGQAVPLNVGTGDTFIWTPSFGLNDSTAANPIATPDTTTTYSVIVTDVCGQIRYDTVTVFVNPDTILDVLPPGIDLCALGTPLQITANTDPFSTLVWSNGDSGAVATVTQPGSYSVTVTNFCRTYSDNIQVGVRPAPTFISQDVDCFGAQNGSATFTNTGGLPYTFTWFALSNGTILANTQSNSPVSTQGNLAPGPYAMISGTSTGCLDTVTFFINEPPDLDLNIQTTQNLTCFGDNSGLIELASTGGTAPYTYSINGGAFQTSGTFSNLPAGTYTVTTSDVNGCLKTTTVTLTEPDEIQPSIVTQKNVDCNGASTGEITLAVANGSTPFQYRIGNGPLQPSPVFSGLAAGNYVVTVVDNDGCESTLPVTMTEPAVLSTSSTITNVDCAGDLTGAISTVGNGGVPGYLFSFQGSPFSAQATFSGLAAGTYQLIVQDDSLCVDTSDLVVQEPVALDVIPVVTNSLCNGDSSGFVVLTGVGGWGNYTFSLDGGPFAPSDTISGLSAGMYQITVQDDSLCTAQQTVTVNEPTEVSLVVTNRQDVDCLGNATGVLEVLASGGTPGYVYSRNGLPSQPSPIFTNLFAGIYTLVAQDANGCEASVDTFLTTPTGLTGGIDTLVDVSCFGDSTGSVTLTAFGGIAPYRYALNGDTITGITFANLPVQTDTLVLLDDNGCIVPIPFTIDQPPLLTLVLDNLKDLACNGIPDGLINLTPSGGTGTYSMTIGGPFQASTLFDSLSAGPYLGIVEDSNGCRDSLDLLVNEPALLVLDTLLVNQVRCFGEDNGGIQLAAAGGSGALVFQLDSLGWGANQTFPGLSGGSYLVQVRDDSLCIDSFTVNISEPDSLILNPLATSDIDCFNSNTGALEVLATGGRPQYQYSLNGGPFQADSSFTNLFAGPYLVTVIDDSLCADTTTITLSQPEPLALEADSLIDVRCFGEGNGQIFVSATGGVQPYQFSLNGGTNQSDSLFSGLQPGTYSVTVTDDSACVFVVPDLLIAEPALLEAFPGTQEVRCFGESTGVAWLDITGGNGSYSTEWFTDPVQTGDTATGLSVGVYGYRTEDLLGCEAAGEIIITEPELLEVQIDSIREAFCDWENGGAWLSSTGGTQPYQYTWDQIQGLEGPSAVDVLGLVYFVEVTDIRGCLDTITVDIPNTPPADARFVTIPDNTAPILESVGPIVFDNQTTGAVTYLWEFGDGNLADEENPIHAYEFPGEYTVTLTAWNSFFVCPTTVSLTLNIIPDGSIYTPNAFTPNGDGRNDIFLVKGEGLIEVEVLIFDRWGRLITRWNDLSQGWDGRIPGQGIAQEGVYTFLVNATTNAGEKIEQGGTVTLIR